MRAEMPILHWTMVNIPATITKLDPGMTDPPAGAQNGPNIRGPDIGLGQVAPSAGLEE